MPNQYCNWGLIIKQFSRMAFWLDTNVKKCNSTKHWFKLNTFLIWEYIFKLNWIFLGYLKSFCFKRFHFIVSKMPSFLKSLREKWKKEKCFFSVILMPHDKSILLSLRKYTWKINFTGRFHILAPIFLVPDYHCLGSPCLNITS